nr:RNA-dependent RNA polymerase [Mute swan feces associated narna-like virus 6]
MFLLSKETQIGDSRQPPNIEKMMESLLETTSISLGGIDVLFNRRVIHDSISKASISSKRRRQLSMSFKKYWGSPNENSFLASYLSLRQCGVSIENLIGVDVGSTRVHTSQGWCRFRHLLGLSDAVHLSMFNLNISVSFPLKVQRKVRSVSKKHFQGAYRSDFLTFRYGHDVPNPSFRRPKIRFSRFLDLSPGKDPLANGTVVLNRSTTKDRRYRLICHYLRVFPRGKLEKEYVKIIKNSLVDEFSLQLEQERPDIPEGRVPLFPEITQKKLDKRFSKDRRGRARFYKNLLEAKSLCAPVGDDMIIEAYRKHKASLCRDESEVLPVPEEFLKELYDYGRRVGKFVSRRYDPYSTKLPNQRATVESNRKMGGARSALSGSLEIQKGALYQSLLAGTTRPEPFVVGLFGPPGSGKTTSVVNLVDQLGGLLFGCNDRKELVYSRSCSTKHWDGYRGQPIVVLDDFGQDLADRSDLVEFEQLVSTNEYILPMANLEEKGQRFVSPLIIVTSNMAFGSIIKSSQNSSVVEDDLAVWRRFHFPIRLLRDQDTGARLLHEYQAPHSFMSQPRQWTYKYLAPTFPQHYVGFQGHESVSDPKNFPEEKYVRLDSPFRNIDHVGTNVFSRFRTHMDFHCQELSGTWRQVISCLRVNSNAEDLRPFHSVFAERVKTPYLENDVSISQIFHSFPPYRAPRVQAVALPEPLKVRMITKAEAETKCLQPLQRALFEYLKSQPQFVLTHGVKFTNDSDFDEKLEWIERIEKCIQEIQSLRKEGDLWLSGDYTAATDNFPLSVTNALVEGILSQIDHEPTKRWVRYEVSPHTIEYPHGLGSGKQTSGQLMGSLLSFPLLCFLNDFIVSRSGVEKGKYLINGDDIVALGQSEFISTWRRDAPKVGLSLSLGKNFIDEHFCTVNSQLFYDAKVQHTGKVSLSTRYGKSISNCFSEMQFYYGTHPELKREFIRRNLLELRKTPRSLSVPIDRGGLGRVFGEDLKSSRHAVDVYLTDYLRSFSRSLPVPGLSHLRAMRIPIGILTDEDIDLAGSPVENTILELLGSLETNPKAPDPDVSTDLTFSQLKSSCELAVKCDSRRVNQLRSRSIRRFPPLDHVRYRTIFVEKGKVGFLKERVISLALNLLLTKVDFGLEDDPDIAFNVIHQEFLDDCDPLFGEQVIRDMVNVSFDIDSSEPGDDKVSSSEAFQRNPMTDLVDIVNQHSGEKSVDYSDYEHQILDLEPRIVQKSGGPRDLVLLLGGNIEE